MTVYEQVTDLSGANSFFGNLRNSNLNQKRHYEGFWVSFTDNNRPWMGVRNALRQGRWTKANPLVEGDIPLKKGTLQTIWGKSPLMKK